MWPYGTIWSSKKELCETIVNERGEIFAYKYTALVHYIWFRLMIAMSHSVTQHIQCGDISNWRIYNGREVFGEISFVWLELKMGDIAEFNVQCTY